MNPLWTEEHYSTISERMNSLFMSSSNCCVRRDLPCRCKTKCSARGHVAQLALFQMFDSNLLALNEQLSLSGDHMLWTGCDLVFIFLLSALCISTSEGSCMFKVFLIHLRQRNSSVEGRMTKADYG